MKEAGGKEQTFLSRKPETVSEAGSEVRVERVNVTVCCQCGSFFPHGAYLTFHCDVHELSMCFDINGLVNMNHLGEG